MYIMDREMEARFYFATLAASYYWSKNIGHMPSSQFMIKIIIYFISTITNCYTYCPNVHVRVHRNPIIS